MHTSDSQSMKDDQSVVELFTDGSCTGNPGPGGWAFILKHPASGHVKQGAGGERQTTNNRMETLAVIHALRALRKPCVVTLYSDSNYVVRGLAERMERQRARGWRRSPKSTLAIKNVDLWRALYELSRQHEINANWIRGHDGHLENELCDQMAAEQARHAVLLPMPAQIEDDDPEPDHLFGQ